MAKLIITLTKEDIKTYKQGCHYTVDVNDILSLNFTPDAIEELTSDYNVLKNKDTEDKND